MEVEQEKMRILIAEDEPIIAMGLEEDLSRAGHTVVGRCPDGLLAVEMAKELRPDLVLMDIKMPELDGIEAARRIQQTFPLPVVILTGYGDPDLVDGAIDAGVVAYLMKPVMKEQLLSAIKVAVRRFEELEVLRKDVEDLKEALETRKIVERAKGLLMDRLGLSEEEAFRRIHCQSRNERRPMRQVAESIVALFAARIGLLYVCCQLVRWCCQSNLSPFLS